MSDKPRLLVTRRLPDAVMARAEKDYDARTNAEDVIWPSAVLPEKAEGCQAILCTPTEKFTAEVIAALPESIRAISSFSVGVDHIDLEAASARDIVVGNTPDVLTDATADIAMLCLLGAARRAYEGQRMLREGRWTRWSPRQLLGRDLRGKRLGIYGMGRIGQAVARRAQAFGMAIHYHNRRRLDPAEEQGATYHATADGLLQVSDVLSLNAPSTAENHHFLDVERIARLPEGAIVVNTARGPLVDDEALIAALKSGRLSAAGLDVYENEPNLHPEYVKLDNAFLLPHMGSATVETRDAMGFAALDNLDAFFAGEEMASRVA